MSLETATYISDLVSSNPDAGDDLGQADDHIRLIKATVLASFPAITGAVTASHTELNNLAGTTYPFTAASLASSSVTAAKLDTGAVTTAKLDASAVTAAKIADSTITAAKLASGAAFSSGMMLPYAPGGAPTGWLACDGSAVSRATYADLFAAIGTKYGVGDGSTTFNVPDTGGRAVVGQESTATRLTSAVSGIDGATIGAAGGAEAHTLVIAEMPQHTHTVVDPGHYHTTRFALFTLAGGGNSTPYTSGTDRNIDTQPSTTGISLNYTGSGDAHANVQPSIVVPWIIKT